MIALNLLPDVKKQFLKAQRTRNLIFTTSLAISLVAIGLIIIGFVTVGGMRYQINRNDDKISKLQSQYVEIDNLRQILTIRNQAQSLEGLHQQKPVVSRLFNVLSVSTPGSVSLNQVEVDFVESRIEVSASTDNFNGVNKYIDTLENTLFTIDDATDSANVFSQIVSEQAINDAQVSVSVTMSFSPAIFDSANKVSFSVPDIETTQSVRQKPLFDTQPEPEQEESDG